MRQSAKVLVCGHLSLDLRPEIAARTAELHPGKLIQIGPLHATCGGAVFNTGVALHKLGIRTSLAGKVGGDEYGHLVLRMIAKHGESLEEGVIVEQGGFTSYSIIMDPKVADRTILHYPGVNDTFDAGEITPAMLNDVQLLHLGYPPLMKKLYADGGQTLKALFLLTRERGAITSLDTALVEPDSEAGRVDWAGYLAHVLPAVDVFLPSFEELCFMLRRTSYPVRMELLSELADELLAFGPAIVCIKLGEHGLYLKTASDRERWAAMGPLDGRVWSRKELYVPCFAVQVNGTTGAGDATIAGFLAGLTHGENPEVVLRSAAAVGACSVSGMDAIAEIPSWAELNRRVSRPMPQRPAELPGAHWRHDDDQGVWVGPYARNERGM